MADKTKRHEANVKFAKLQRAQTAQRVTSDYEATAAALRAKTERLKALRLERDAAAPKPAPARSVRRTSQAAKPTYLRRQRAKRQPPGRRVAVEG